MLSQQEQNDLRKRVLRGEPLTLDEARNVLAALRKGQETAILSAGSAKLKKAKKETFSDAQLDADLADLGL